MNLNLKHFTDTLNAARTIMADIQQNGDGIFNIHNGERAVSDIHWAAGIMDGIYISTQGTDDDIDRLASLMQRAPSIGGEKPHIELVYTGNKSHFFAYLVRRTA